MHVRDLGLFRPYFQNLESEDSSGFDSLAVSASVTTTYLLRIQCLQINWCADLVHGKNTKAEKLGRLLMHHGARDRWPTG